MIEMNKMNKMNKNKMNMNMMNKNMMKMIVVCLEDSESVTHGRVNWDG